MARVSREDIDDRRRAAGETLQPNIASSSDSYLSTSSSSLFVAGENGGHILNKMKMSKLSNQTNSQDPQAVNSRVFVGNLNTFQCSKTDVERMFQRYGRLAGKNVAEQLLYF